MESGESETITTDGVEYRITVERKDAQFSARWQCMKCKTGSAAQPQALKSVAVAVAKTYISKHHNQNHISSDSESAP